MGPGLNPADGVNAAMIAGSEKGREESNPKDVARSERVKIKRRNVMDNTVVHEKKIKKRMRQCRSKQITRREVSYREVH